MREFKVGDEVTLVEAMEADNGFTLSEEHVGEVIDLLEEHYVVAFQALVDSEGVTPVMHVTEDEIELLY